MGVLRVLMIWSWPLHMAQIASTLEVDPGAVEGIVSEYQLFYIRRSGSITLLPYVKRLLQDVNRAGKYYIPPNDLNPDYHSIYVRIYKICYG